jgi:hypothetical protein
MTGINRFADDHPDLTGFCGFVFLVLLMGFILDSTESLTLAPVVGTPLVDIGSLITQRGQSADSWEKL